MKLSRLFAFSVSAGSGHGVELRERLYFSELEIHNWISDNKHLFKSFLYFKTCHRVEFYFDLGENGDSEWILSLFNEIDVDKFYGTEVVKHLAMVISSADSQVIGETQVTGQFKQAVQLYIKNSWLNGLLLKAVHFAQKIAKRIRTQCLLGEGTVSVAHVAMNVSKEFFEDFTNKSIAIVGAGPMAKQCLFKARQMEYGKIYWLNRSPVNQSSTVGFAQFKDLSSFPEVFNLAQVFVFATSAGYDLLSLDRFKELVAKSCKYPIAPKIFLDLSMPRNVDPRISAVSDCYYRGIDDFHNRVSENKHKRSLALSQIEVIIQEEIINFKKLWQIWALGALRAQFSVVFARWNQSILASQPPICTSGKDKNKKTSLNTPLSAKIGHQLLQSVDDLDPDTAKLVLKSWIKAFRLCEEEENLNASKHKNKPKNSWKQEKSSLN